jgi:hypothetical protein
VAIDDAIEERRPGGDDDGATGWRGAGEFGDMPQGGMLPNSGLGHVNPVTRAALFVSMDQEINDDDEPLVTVNSHCCGTMDLSSRPFFVWKKERFE